MALPAGPLAAIQTRQADPNQPGQLRGVTTMTGFESKRQASKDLLELQSAKAIANEQSYDTGLWFVATTVTEAHLQAALRRLTAAVEGEAP